MLHQIGVQLAVRVHAAVRVRKPAIAVPRELREHLVENGRNRDPDHLEELLFQSEPYALEAGQEMIDLQLKSGKQLRFDFVG